MPRRRKLPLIQPGFSLRFPDRQRSEQNRTFSQSRAHFLRQLNGRRHLAHIFVGRSDFLRILATGQSCRMRWGAECLRPRLSHGANARYRAPLSSTKLRGSAWSLFSQTAIGSSNNYEAASLPGWVRELAASKSDRPPGRRSECLSETCPSRLRVMLIPAQRCSQ